MSKLGRVLFMTFFTISVSFGVMIVKKVTVISPYHGGSHKAWAAGWQTHSRHEVALLTLPDRFWKWRMHGGAVTLARRWREGVKRGELDRPDVFLATDMLDVTTFLALTRPYTAHTPLILYMHENQLTYPLPQDGRTGPMRRQMGERDYHYVFINYASMLAADRILFNSRYHLKSWFAALPNFLKHFPEYNELGSIERLREKSDVLPVGVDFSRLEIGDRRLEIGAKSLISNLRSPLILWNQRWEYDKNPGAFFAALYAAAEAGLPFRVALCGQVYGKRPSIFHEAQEKLGDRIIHAGFADEEMYRRLLWEAAVVISTAHHEFFGIAILEAVYCQTFPLLPRRLSYPELIPEAYHLQCLYDNQEGLVQRLKWALTHGEEVKDTAVTLSRTISRFNWSHMAPHYDAEIGSILKIEPI
ncbi:MAG TPA: DUF3524 domain-containing protein [Anaerolineae bacterium]|nr:DUF3524 domain-containing protein [Anaerolineae bacterium]